MLAVPATGLLAGHLAELRRGSETRPEDLKTIAAEFESLLLAKLLESMRGEDASGWLGGGDGQAGGLAIELAEQQLAQALAAQGGLGLAELVVQGLSRSQANERFAKAADKG